MPQQSSHKHRTLLIATTNQGKVAEFATLLAGSRFDVINLTDLPQAIAAVEETGATFAENALIKAEHYHARTGLLTLADDSGLEVDALGGRPGVYSARYGGEGWTSQQQIELLLDELKEVEAAQRTTRFVCSIALVGNGISEIFEGRCGGLVTFEPRGKGGFGYDPVFIVPDLNLTFAEITREQKAALSHRGRALRLAQSFLGKI